MASETSSIVSLPIHSTLDEAPEPMDITPAITPLKPATRSSSTTPTPAKDASPLKVNGGFSPAHTSSPRLVPLRDKDRDKPLSSSSSNRKTTDSAIFKEGSIENLFGDDSNLFDTKELDAFFKKEKTPERIDEEKPDNDSPDRGLSPAEVVPQKGRVPPVITPVIKPKKRQSVDSPRTGGMKANLHRYESNSSVSKTDTTEDTKPSPIPEDLAPSKTPTFDDLFSADKPSLDTPSAKKIEDSPSKKPEVDVPSTNKSPFRKHKVDSPSVKDPPSKKPKPKVAIPSAKKIEGSPSRKPKAVDSPFSKKVTDSPSKKRKVDDTKLGIEDSPSKKKNAPSPKATKKTLLFEDDEDDLFGPTVKEDTKKKTSDEKAIDIKKASLFSDDSGELFVDKPVLPVQPSKSEPSKDASSVLKTEEKNVKDSEETDAGTAETEAKKSHDLFGDSIEAFDEKEATEKKDSPKKKADTTDIFGETPLFKDITSTAKHSNLFDEDDNDDLNSPSLFSSQRRLQKNQKKTAHTMENDDSLFGDIDTSPPSSPKEKTTVVVVEVDVSDPLGAIEIEVTEPAKKSEKTEEVEAPSEEIPVADEKSEEDTMEDKPAKTDADSSVSDTADSTKPPQAEKAKTNDDSEDGKPSWMAELKKRKHTKGSDAPSVAPKKEPVEPPMPEWKKKALERKKKAESGSVSPKPGRMASPKPGWNGSPKPARNGSPKPACSSKSPVKTATSKSPLSDRKSPGVAASTDSPSTKKFKTRQEREKEAKERKEKEEKQMEEIRLKYKAKREKEKEEKEKQLKEQKEERPRYKTRKEREREAKEKEEQEKEAKEKEVREQLAKEGSTTETATSPKPEKPALARKPSIEVISKKTSSASTKSFDATDEGKPARKDSEGSKKDVEDDVFSTGDSSEQRSASSHSLRRTPSPKIAIELISTVLDPAKDVVANGHSETSTQAKTSEEQEATKAEEEEDKMAEDSSPSATQNGSHSDKSSVSSERDLTESKPFRSHSQSMSVSSRSPTPPLIPSSSNSVPEWKKKLMEKKKSPSTSGSPVHKVTPKAVEIPGADANLPQWKRELLAKKKAKPDSKVRDRHKPFGVQY